MSRLPFERKFNAIWPAANTVAAFFLFLFVTTLTATQPAHSQTFHVIHSFSGGADGYSPTTGLTLDATGNLYGAASFSNGQSCPFNCLEVYRLAPNGPNWNFTTLFSGQDEAEGSTPESSMVFGPDGSLYGTTINGGINDCYPNDGCGVVFKLTPGNGGWTESTLYQFSSIPKGGFPSGQLVFDRAGNLYGTTAGGGSTLGCQDFCSGNGVVYKLALSDGAPTETDLYTFGEVRASDGISPSGGVIFDGAGNLYGTTTVGGEFYNGTVFKLTPNGDSWLEQILYNFPGGDDGLWPNAGVIMDAAGNLYGGTQFRCRWTGGGSAFELSPGGGSWTYQLLYDFPSVGCTVPYRAGEGPLSNLVMDSAGNLYGATYKDGQYGHGNVFKLSHTANGWTYTSLHDFTGGADGAYPWGSLVIDSTGDIYGTTTSGGTGDLCPFGNIGCGVVFEITP